MTLVILTKRCIIYFLFNEQQQVGEQQHDAGAGLRALANLNRGLGACVRACVRRRRN